MKRLSLQLSSISALIVAAGCNLQGSGSKIDGNFRPGYQESDQNSETPTPTAETPTTPTPTAAPTLTTLTSKKFPASYLDQGVALSLDVNDTANSGEAASGYTCYFDKIVDAAVVASAACSSLPGSVDTSTLATTGTLVWTPDATAFGAFEIKFTGTNTLGSDDEFVTVHVRQPFSTTSLAAYWDVQFATGTTTGNNSASTAQIQDLVNLTTNSGDLTNFDFLTNGWNGDGGRSITAAADGPFRLTFDGVDDFVDFTAEQNALTDMTIETWVRPTAVATLGAVIAGNRDAPNDFGMQIRQSTANAGKIELVVGNGTLICESTQTLSDNLWYHIAGVFDGTADSATLYINGTQECTAVNGGQILEGSTIDFRVGADDAGANIWTGALAELRIYSVAVAHTTLKDNFVATAPRFPDVLSTVSNLALWLDAAKGVTVSGSTVTAWADQSGNSNNAAASVAGQEPTFLTTSINNRPAVRFVATGSVMKVADSASLNPASITVIAVFTRQAGSTNDAKLICRPFDTAESGGAPFYSWSAAARFAGTDALAIEAHTGGGTLSVSDTTATFADATPHMFMAMYDSGGPTMSAFVSGVTAPLNAPGTAPTGPIDYTEVGQNIWIGSSPYADHLEGDIAELIIYGGTMTADERLRIQSYLNAKYALYP